MRAVLIAALILTASVPAAAIAQEAAPQAAKYSVAKTTIKDLMANEATKAVLLKHMPQIAQAVDMVGDQTLQGLKAMAGDQLPDKLLADIDADLAKIK